MQGRLWDRLAVLEGKAAAQHGEDHRAKEERDAAVAIFLADPAAKECALATMASIDSHRRAAVSAALRADR